jgi:hypothetical protein
MDGQKKIRAEVGIKNARNGGHMLALQVKGEDGALHEVQIVKNLEFQQGFGMYNQGATLNRRVQDVAAKKEGETMPVFELVEIGTVTYKTYEVVADGLPVAFGALKV